MIVVVAKWLILDIINKNQEYFYIYSFQDIFGQIRCPLNKIVL